MLETTGDSEEDVDSRFIWVALANGPTNEGDENDDQCISKDKSVKEPPFVPWKSSPSPVKCITVCIQKKQGR